MCGFNRNTITPALVDLKPQEMLLLWHFAHGGNLANFRDTAAEVMERMAYWKGRDKRAVFHVWKTITRKMPFLDALFVRGNERRAISKHRMDAFYTRNCAEWRGSATEKQKRISPLILLVEMRF